MSASSIREMIDADLPGVLEIERSSFSNPWTREKFLELLDQANVAAYVYMAGRQVLAYMILSFDHTEAHIVNLAVQPSQRRKGIAGECLRFADGIALRRDVAQISLEVEETNLAAQLCYKKAGYLGTRVLWNYYADTQEDGYRMVRRLRHPVRSAN